MPQPLDARIAAAMGNGARAATVAELIAELDTAIAGAQADHDRLDALAKSATATEPEAEAAADEAAKLFRKIIRLGAKRVQLAERSEELLNSERRKRGEADHAAAKATRDQLAADLAEHWPRLTGEMVDLLDRIVASDAECERVNVNRYGREQLGSAEAEARKCPGNWYMPGGGPIRRFIQMIIPSLSAAGAGEAWPRPKPNVLAMSAEAERRSRIRMKEAASAERERWRRYVVTAPERGGDMVFIQTRQGRNGVHRNAAIHEMTREQIADAKANGCGVTLAKPNETIGAPAGITTF